MGDCSTLLCRQEAAQLWWVGSLPERTFLDFLPRRGRSILPKTSYPFALFIRARGIYNERECARAHTLTTLYRRTV